MAVYVDPLFDWGTLGIACRMTADMPEELHAFAKALGCRRSWAVGRTEIGLHYYINEARRRAAVAAGAEEITLLDGLRRVEGGMKTEGEADADRDTGRRDAAAE